MSKLNSLGANAAVGKLLLNVFDRAAAEEMVEQQQSSRGQGTKDARPKIENRGVQFENRIERSECQMALGQGRQRYYGGRISGRCEAAHAARNANQFFSVESRLPFRVQDDVGNAIIDC